MLSRRSLTGSALLTGVAASLPSQSFGQTGNFHIMGYERGDRHAPRDPVVYDPDFVDGLISPMSLTNVIPDPVSDFGTALISVAQEYIGFDRTRNEPEITKILDLFGCPFKDKDGKYVAFCAAGVGYCAVVAMAKASKMSTDVSSLRRLLPVIDYYNYYPSPGVLNMSLVTRGKSRWVEARTANKKPVPEKGWLIVYDWSGSTSPEVTSHTGIVLGLKGSKIETLEFNTSDKDHNEGGAVLLKQRDYDKTIKGFIKTASRHTNQ